jgi:hypothetical protein
VRGRYVFEDRLSGKESIIGACDELSDASSVEGLDGNESQTSIVSLHAVAPHYLGFGTRDLFSHSTEPVNDFREMFLGIVNGISRALFLALPLEAWQ